MTSTERTQLLSHYGRNIAEALRAIAPLKPWTFVEPTEDTYSVYLRNAGKARIYLQFDGYGHEKPTRLSISGHLNIGKNNQYVEVYEMGADGTGWYKASVPSITVTCAKNPEAIAKDIMRRFLPEYVRVLALAEDKLAKDTAYEAKIAANLLRLADVAGVEINSTEHLNGRGEVRKDFTLCIGESQYHKVNVTDHDADLKLDSLTFEQAEYIIRYLKGTK